MPTDGEKDPAIGPKLGDAELKALLVILASLNGTPFSPNSAVRPGDPSGPSQGRLGLKISRRWPSPSAKARSWTVSTDSHRGEGGWIAVVKRMLPR